MSKFLQTVKKSFSPFPVIPVIITFGCGAVWGLLYSPTNRFLRARFVPFAFEGQCTKIIDADTIVVKSVMDGDYTVSFASARVPDKGSKRYKEALRFTTDTLLNKTVTVQPTWGEDTGVIDGWVYYKTTCFDAELIKAGYGKEYPNIPSN